MEGDPRYRVEGDYLYYISPMGLVMRRSLENGGKWMSVTTRRTSEVRQMPLYWLQRNDMIRHPVNENMLYLVESINPKGVLVQNLNNKADRGHIMLSTIQDYILLDEV